MSENKIKRLPISRWLLSIIMGLAFSLVLRPTPQEYWLVKLILLQDDVVPWVAAHLDHNWIQHPGARQVVAARLSVGADQSWQGVAAFVTECEAQGLRNLVTEATADDRPVPMGEHEPPARRGTAKM